MAEACHRLGLKHVVVTAVARDDLADGGAQHFADTIRAIRAKDPDVVIEVLVPDFNMKNDALLTVMEAAPEVFNHNLETVERLTPLVRSRAKYTRSLEVLEQASNMAETLGLKTTTKSGMMLGLGESQEEVLVAMDDLRKHGVEVLTLGQYLRPSANHLPVVEYIHPDVFAALKEKALSKGFIHVSSGPLVRSSYHAGDFSPDSKPSS